MAWFAKSITFAAVAATALAFTSPASARPASVRSLAAQELRLATIAYRIAAANADACLHREVITGLVVHDLTRYSEKLRPAVSRAFSMTSGFGVLAIVPGSVAAEADLRVDDEILAVGSVHVAVPGIDSQPKSYRRMEQFHAVLQRELTKGQADLLVRRGGSFLKIPMRAKYGCGGKLALTSSSTLNAWSDGKHVVVTTGMTELSRSNDEIAFVIAHEMAHNILGHSGSDGRARGIFGFAKIKRGEIAADGYAVRLMANAGYSPAGGISFLENARSRLWWNFSLDHPGFGRRIEIVAAAMRAHQSEALARTYAADQPTAPSPFAAIAEMQAHSVGPRLRPAVSYAFGQLGRSNGSCQR